MGEMTEIYMGALKREIIKWGGSVSNRPIDTIYIGGGTPSLYGEHLGEILDLINKNFSVTENAEITAEANPEDIDFLPIAKENGINRLSIGAQTFNDNTLKVLGRRHTALDTERFYYNARQIGFDNISLDLMIALPKSDKKDLEADLKKMAELSPEHISSYILKVEEKTKFFKDNIELPSEDDTANAYLYTCEFLKGAGYNHYEISNFAKNGKESRHNLKYWQGGEYIGIGPAAHSFLSGKRFFYPADIKRFVSSGEITSDGTGGSESEKFMLALRTSSGADIEKMYGTVPKEIKDEIENLIKHGLLYDSYPIIKLTDKGMLVSNSIITELTI